MSTTKKLKIITEGTYKGCYVLEEQSVLQDIEAFQAGVYKLVNIGQWDIKPMYEPVKDTEQYISFDTGIVKKILDTAAEFFSTRVVEKYAYLKIAHKLGMVLYGKAGTGKTVAANLAMKKLAVEYGAVCLLVKNSTDMQVIDAAVKELKTLNTPIVMFIDECEYSFRRMQNEWLTFFDGHSSITNFLFIGCTNYFNDINNRLLRPSRLSLHIAVESIDRDMAYNYIKEKLPLLKEELWAGIADTVTEAKATMDCFKTAVRDFYLTDSTTAEEFKKFLKHYVKLDHLLAIGADLSELQESEEEQENDEKEISTFSVPLSGLGEKILMGTKVTEKF